MASLRVSLIAICAAAATVLADPTVTLDSGVFTGTTVDGTNQFLGIPFAQPPVGDLRFRLPQALGPYSGDHDATAFGFSCPQQAANLAVPPGLPLPTLEYLQAIGSSITSVSEDCLTVNVLAPAQAIPGSNFPVVVWIYGGGFEDGSSASFDGTAIVARSIALDQPVLYVSMNYRVSAFGFLASKEVKAAGVGNIGLWDQRLALQWVQKYIHAFGGDPTKVTIWGESAGAISVSLQMLTNGGNPDGLFRAAFMQSGSPTPVGDIINGQPYYNFLVQNTSCSAAPDTLECLRGVPFATLMAAINFTPSLFSYQSLDLAWQPRADGVFLPDGPQKLVLEGKVANVPFVAGECDDEGTLFSLSNVNVTTDAQLLTYLKQFFFSKVPNVELNVLLALYPQNPALGSPFNTGDLNELTTEFKRIAAILGDFVFQAPRRFFLHSVSGKQNTWSYLSKRLKSLPFLGSAHASDISVIYSGGDLTDYLINFATNLNPNGPTVANWPQYTASSPQLLTLYDAPVLSNATSDTYRAAGMAALTAISLAHPL